MSKAILPSKSPKSKTFQVAARKPKFNTGRTYQFRARLSKAAYQQIDERLAAHCRLYNAALEQRKTAYKRRGVTVGFYEQSHGLVVPQFEIPKTPRPHLRRGVLSPQGSQATAT